jgi:glycosyl transferase family 25
MTPVGSLVLGDMVPSIRSEAGLLQCFGISLPRFQERHAYISGHLASLLGSGFEIVGFDGASNAVPPVQGDLTAGQIGCARSHMVAYEHMVARDLPWALIVEDDVVLPPNIRDILSGIEAALQPGDVVLLYNRPEHRAAFSTVDTVRVGDFRLCLPMRMSGLGTAAAYVITRQAAEGILRLNNPVSATADNWSAFFEGGAIVRGRMISPNPVTLKPFESTIFASGSRIGAAMRGSRILRSLLAVRRRFLTARMTANMTFVDAVSPYADRSPR